MNQAATFSATVESILVVDDSATDSHLICTALNGAGFQAIAASNAEDGIAMAKQYKPSLIIMDIVMPGGSNGFQATRTLHKMPETNEIPILVLSSKSKRSDQVWALRQGAADYLTKPFVQSDLINKVRQLI